MNLKKFSPKKSTLSIQGVMKYAMRNDYIKEIYFLGGTMQCLQTIIVCITKIR